MSLKVPAFLVSIGPSFPCLPSAASGTSSACERPYDFFNMPITFQSPRLSGFGVRASSDVNN